MLAGCGAGERDAFDSPIDLYHDLQGGTIASQRPPPPGVGQPFPALASVPGRPTPTSAAGRQAIYAALVSEHDRVTRENGRDPLLLRPQDMPPSPAALPAAPPKPATPKVPAATATGSPPAATEAEDGPSVAVLPAADAPARSSRPEPGARPAAPLGPLPPLEARVAAGAPVPDIPAGPPAAPSLEGEPASPGAPGSVNVYFRRGSTAVPLDAGAALRQLATERHDRTIDVRAPGDPVARTVDGAATTLAMGLRRAQAIAAVLADAGVPPGALRVLAEGTGQEGVARVMDRN